MKVLTSFRLSNFSCLLYILKIIGWNVVKIKGKIRNIKATENNL
jgi:hypothetical protein